MDWLVEEAGLRRGAELIKGAGLCRWNWSIRKWGLEAGLREWGGASGSGAEGIGRGLWKGRGLGKWAELRE